MKLPRPAVITLYAAILFTASAATVFVGYRTVSNSGDSAVEAMNSEEVTSLNLLTGIRPEMTREEVRRTLGEPSEDLYFYTKWDSFGGSPLSQARVYFTNNHPREIRWLKIGFFVYEKKYKYFRFLNHRQLPSFCA